MFSTRAEAIVRRTYSRPKEDGTYESWDEIIDRVISHQRRLWEEAGSPDDKIDEELSSLDHLLRGRYGSLAGRTNWLGGTDVAFDRPNSQFNCANLDLSTGYDFVDAVWNLLNGCGQGAKIHSGVLRGFDRFLEVEVVPSKRSASDRGVETNSEQVGDGTWRITFGDCAEAWAKAIGKLLIHRPREVERLVLDFSEIRGPGERLKGYGWICNGYQPLADACVRICKVLNNHQGQLLDELAIHDIFNLCGTILSSRRSAEIVTMDAHNPRAREFATFKRNFWEDDNNHRQQSNNSLVYWSRPSKEELRDLFKNVIIPSGGSEPGLVNGEAALRKAPWFKGFNPCAEILLPDKGFCNLVELCLPRFGGNLSALLGGAYLLGRANYRQTCVDLRDGILQPGWHQNNDTLRLCGVGLTGIAQCPGITPYEIGQVRHAAQAGAHSMADELGTPRSKAVTTIKPSGTLSKIMDCTEGIHKPLGKYIFNNVNFSVHDPLVERFVSCGYDVIPNPTDSNNVVVKFPVEYDKVLFDHVDGKQVNLESAVTQLNRYKKWMTYWCDHNVSVTISYDIDEVESICEWLYYNWDHYVAVSFIFRNDPTKTAKDLGYPYLPQEVVTENDYREYTSRLREVNFEDTGSSEEIESQECAGGACPVR